VNIAFEIAIPALTQDDEKPKVLKKRQEAVLWVGVEAKFARITQTSASSKHPFAFHLLRI
jgi:hypothetical protein